VWYYIKRFTDISQSRCKKVWDLVSAAPAGFSEEEFEKIKPGTTLGPHDKEHPIWKFANIGLDAFDEPFTVDPPMFRRQSGVGMLSQDVVRKKLCLARQGCRLSGKTATGSVVYKHVIDPK
jgi:hypothetical protein